MTKEFRVEKVQETHNTWTFDVRDRADVFVSSHHTKREADAACRRANAGERE